MQAQALSSAEVGRAADAALEQSGSGGNRSAERGADPADEPGSDKPAESASGQASRQPADSAMETATGPAAREAPAEEAAAPHPDPDPAAQLPANGQQPTVASFQPSAEASSKPAVATGTGVDGQAGGSDLDPAAAGGDGGSPTPLLPRPGLRSPADGGGDDAAAADRDGGGDGVAAGDPAEPAEPGSAQSSQCFYDGRESPFSQVNSGTSKTSSLPSLLRTLQAQCSIGQLLTRLPHCQQQHPPRPWSCCIAS